MAHRSLAGKTVLITGASRGIGRAIGLRAAQDGAKVAILAKTTQPHPKLPGTIGDAAQEMIAAGGQALALRTDLRDEAEVEAAVRTAAAELGGIDVVVNNASVLSLSGLEETTLKMYDRMFAVNARGSFLVTKLALPHLLRAENPHVLNIAPPPNLNPRWFARNAPYTAAKYAMSFWVLGFAEEFRAQGVGFNALWPRTAIATAAVRNLLGGEPMVQRSRRPEIMADAAHAVLTRNARQFTGRFLVDEDVLREEGFGDDEIAAYAVDPDAEPYPDFFLD
ncbi:MAG: NAD(P)-dependent oxidoreductase [Candidatus Krumholzibacteriia bacterium]